MKVRLQTILYFVVLVAAMAVVVSLFWKTASSRLFFYDEADYMYAGTRGFVNNYLDRPSLSAVEFIRKGLELAHDKSQRSNMSQYVRSSGDITFYRHYHGPAYAYWIALGQALGFHDEATYRASGLILHVLSTTLIFWMFRFVFPEYPPIAAFVAALTFLLNRTALVSATTITQHVMFTLTAGVTLFLMAQFFRSGLRRWWYACVAALAVSFATVESSFILVATIVLLLVIHAPRMGWKTVWQLFWRGILTFAAVSLVVWPKGIFQLGVVKGYLYLAYMALSRKTFTPISPVEFWVFKLREYPDEFVIPIVALVATALWWKKLSSRQAILPFFVYSWMFIGVTMVITLPYTYYHASLLMSCSVVVGAMFGELWRKNAMAGIGAAVIVLISLVEMDVRYYRETVVVKTASDPRFELLAYVKSEKPPRTLYVPFVLVPTLHFYTPELTAIGYEANRSPTDFASALLAAGPNAEFFCEQALCDAVESQFQAARVVPVMGADKELDEGPLYSVVVNNGLPLNR